MSHINKSDMEDLISGYIDGELSQRQLTEVKRLIRHDEEFAEEYRRLERQKELLGALPVEHAPAETLEEIKHHLAKKHSAAHYGAIADESAGARHLLFKRTLTAAAMLLLVGVLAVVISNIILPVSVSEESGSVASKILQGPGQIRLETQSSETVEAAAAGVRRSLPINAALEIKTSDSIGVNTFIEKAIYNTGLLDQTIPRRQSSSSSYRIICPGERLAMLFEELGGVWLKSQSTTMTVYGQRAESDIVINDISPGQVASVFEHDKSDDYIEFAKGISKLNSAEHSLAGNEQLAPVKPVLTSGRASVTVSEGSGTEGPGDVTLTIIVTGL
jgi:hypothetical protein